MTEQNDNAEEILMDTVINKLRRQDEQSGTHEKRITAIEGKIAGPQSKFPEEKVQELIKRLDSALSILQHPPKSEVRHIHHFPAILWVAGGLFLTLCLVSSGWFMTGQTLEQFRAGDYKYRYLKVFMDSAVTDYLFKLDSVYKADPDSFQNVVVTQERLKEHLSELLYQMHAVDSQIKGGENRAGEKKKLSR